MKRWNKRNHNDFCKQYIVINNKVYCFIPQAISFANYIINLSPFLIFMTFYFIIGTSSWNAAFLRICCICIIMFFWFIFSYNGFFEKLLIHYYFIVFCILVFYLFTYSFSSVFISCILVFISFAFLLFVLCIYILHYRRVPRISLLACFLA